MMQMETDLAMARSLGDADGKQQKQQSFATNNTMLIATPSVITVEPISPYLSGTTNCLFVILASDGVTEMLSTEHLMNVLGQAICSSDDESVLLEEVTHQLLNQAAQQWDARKQRSYRDDMTLIAAKIR